MNPIILVTLAGTTQDATEEYPGLRGPISYSSSPPDLPHLNIYDIDEDRGKPVSCVFGHDNDYIQTSLIQNAPMQFIEVGSDLTTFMESKAIYTMRLSKILGVIEFGPFDATNPDLTSNVTIRIVYIDTSDTLYVGEQKILTPLPFPVDNKSVSEIFSFPTLGAKAALIYIEAASKPISVKLTAV